MQKITQQRGKELGDRDAEQVVGERQRMEDGNEGGRGQKRGQRMEDKGQSDKGCWLQNTEHGIDAKALQSLKVKIKKQRKR